MRRAILAGSSSTSSRSSDTSRPARRCRTGATRACAQAWPATASPTLASLKATSIRRAVARRDLLILIRVIFVRLLVGLRIGAVREEATDTETRFGVRMDTLAGHILHGSEWVQVVKDHRSGIITMHLDVQWRPAHLLTWWMALGFRQFGRQSQARWRKLAARRLRYLGAGMEARAICGSEGTPA